MVLAPRQIGDGVYASIATSTFHTFAVKSDRTLWCQGRNVEGQLATGNYAAVTRLTQALGTGYLEVGVGQGTDLVQFAKGGAEVFGIDITPRHLELAARNFEVRGLSANLQHAPAAAIPFASESFDLVYSFGVLHCTDNTVRSLTECHRVLNLGCSPNHGNSISLAFLQERELDRERYSVAA